MPQFQGEGATSGSEGENQDSHRHGDPGPPTIGKESGHRSDEAVDQDVQGKHHGYVSTAPAELRQDGGEEYRKGMANPVDENHANEACKDEGPTIRNGGFVFHVSCRDSYGSIVISLHPKANRDLWST